MKTPFCAILTLLGVCAASAGTVSYDFSTPANTNLGSYTSTFASTPSGYSITAYGFENGKTNNLYAKNEGSDSGLGLAGQNDFEIDDSGLVVLDISSLSSATTLQLEIDSVERGEGFAVYGLTSSAFSGGSKDPTLPGKALVTGGSSLNGDFFSVPNFANYKYLAVTATEGNVLVEGLTANIAGVGALAATPEPATLGFVGLALIGLSLGGRGVRQSRS